MLRFVLLAGVAVGLLTPAAADEVHFGSHVSIGGHDVSHQNFDRRHRGVYYLYARQPRHAGCVIRANADGSQTKVCRYQQLH